MPRTRLLLGLIAVVFVVLCSKHHEPTIFPIPPDAKKVYEVSLLDGQAYQAGFVLNVRYPSTVALEHYSKLISKPSYYCVWGRGEWESFLDATGMDSKGRTTRFQRTGTHCGAISQLRPRRGRNARVNREIIRPQIAGPAVRRPVQSLPESD